MRTKLLRGARIASLVLTAITCAAFVSSFELRAQQSAQQNVQDPWPELAANLFKGRSLANGAGLIAIEMPGRADDAAIVPMTVRTTLPAADPRRVKSFTVVIDENPAPVARAVRPGRHRRLQRAVPPTPGGGQC
jgi:sulfur-oxidizing protein SoxY